MMAPDQRRFEKIHLAQMMEGRPAGHRATTKALMPDVLKSSERCVIQTDAFIYPPNVRHSRYGGQHGVRHA